MTTTLQERYDAVHTAILAGPNRELQEWVDSGLAWHLEGFIGRSASDALAAGALVLSPQRTRDYWGTPIPAYTDLVDEVGSSGSVANAEAYES